jgi:hypothetical protein
MKLRILLGALLLVMFTSDAANAQRYYHRGWGYRKHGYHRRGPAVVVVPPRPVIVHRGYYGPRYNRGYYRGGYHRGYYADYHRRYYHHRW